MTPSLSSDQVPAVLLAGSRLDMILNPWKMGWGSVAYSSLLSGGWQPFKHSPTFLPGLALFVEMYISGTSKLNLQQTCKFHEPTNHPERGEMGIFLRSPNHLLDHPVPA
jgi:hypothetical protein